MVETDIPEGAPARWSKVGSPCEIVLDAFPGKRYRGEAVEISPRVNRAKATVGVKVKFVDDADGVLPDMSARVSFLTQALDADALAAKPKTVVPASALAERGGAKVVFVLEGDSRAHARRDARREDRQRLRADGRARARNARRERSAGDARRRPARKEKGSNGRASDSRERRARGEQVRRRARECRRRRC